MQNKQFKNKSICIISDCFVPKRNSAAGMIYNLAKSLSDDNARIICVHGGKNPYKNVKIFQDYQINEFQFITSDILDNIRDKNLILRFFFEITLSISLTFKIIFNIKICKNINLIIWYGPSVFLWLPALFLKIISKARVYYVLRDIFPDWLISVGIIKSRILIKLFNIISYPQYLIPSMIGVEAPENLNIIESKLKKTDKLEVLYNWPSLNTSYEESVKIDNLNDFIKHKEQLKKINKIVGVYIGNIGLAQDLSNLIDFFSKFDENNGLSVNFFTSKKINKYIQKYNFKKNNFKVWRSIPDTNLVGLLKLQDFGIVSLNPNLKTNNIPGKFVSYTQFGLPIMCFANKNSKLSQIILDYNCGIVVDLRDNFVKNLDKINNFCFKLKNTNNQFCKNSNLVHNKLFDIKNAKQRFLKFLD